MARFNFCDGFWALPNITAESQDCMNLYPQAVESGVGASAMTLESTPGLSLVAQQAGAANAGRGCFTVQNRTFWAIDAELYELTAAGLTALGIIGNDGKAVSFAACPQQLLVASAGIAYSFQLQTQTLASGAVITAGTFQQVPAAPWGNAPVTQVGYLDGFFFVLVANSQTIYASNLFDATTWPGLAVKIINTFADNVISMICDHRFMYLFGPKAAEVDYDAGNFPFPLAALQSGYMEQGCGAQFSACQCDNTIFWIGARNDQGIAIAWRASGSQPIRISTHAIEKAWEKYPTVADAISFVYQEGGHTFWCITFPTAQATWAYDVATSRWHRRGYWNGNLGIFQAALPMCHTFNFGKHLVGDRTSGKIYQMSEPVASGGAWNFVTDNGALIRRVRVAPHINTEHQWMRYSLLEIYLETGMSPQPPLKDGTGNWRGPELFLRCSRDGGHTWGQPRYVDCGQAGNYLTRAVFRRLGRARDMVFEVSCSDPIPWRFTDAFVNPQPTPKKRLVHTIGEVA